MFCGSHDFFIHEHCRHDRAGKDPGLCCELIEVRLLEFSKGMGLRPSAETDGGMGWIRADGGWPPPTDWTGKWLLFWSRAEVDDAWAKVRAASQMGGLGYAAKVADHTNLTNSGGHTCCVYTADCRDVADVGRVLNGLRYLGFSKTLYYKDDAATDALMYGRAGVLYRAPAGSTEFIKVREPITPVSITTPPPPS